MHKQCHIPYGEWFGRANAEWRMFSSIVLHGHVKESRKVDGIETNTDVS